MQNFGNQLRVVGCHECHHKIMSLTKRSTDLLFLITYFSNFCSMVNSLRCYNCSDTSSPNCTEECTKAQQCFYRQYDADTTSLGCLEFPLSLTHNCGRINLHLHAFKTLKESTRFCYSCNDSFCNNPNTDLLKNIILPPRPDDVMSCYQCSSTSRLDCDQQIETCNGSYSCYVKKIEGDYSQGCMGVGLFTDQECDQNDACLICENGHKCNGVSEIEEAPTTTTEATTTLTTTTKKTKKPRKDSEGRLKCFYCEGGDCDNSMGWKKYRCLTKGHSCFSVHRKDMHKKGCADKYNSRACQDVHKHYCNLCYGDLCNSGFDLGLTGGKLIMTVIAQFAIIIYI